MEYRSCTFFSLVCTVISAQIALVGSINYVVIKDTLTFEAARAKCATLEGDVVDFRDDTSIENARTLMIQNSVDHIWLNAKQTLNPWVWITDCQLVGDQGCYLDKAKNAVQDFKKGDPDMSTYNSVSELRKGDCKTTCQSQSVTNIFYSLQKGLKGTSTTSEYLCGCGASFGRHRDIGLSHCPAKCTDGDDKFCTEATHFARVFATAGTPYPEWSENWHNDRYKHTICGSFVKEHTASASRFKVQFCHSTGFPLCEVRNSFEGSHKMPKSGLWLRPMFNHPNDWTEARRVCQSLHAGADLVKVDTAEKVADLMETLDGVGTYWIAAIKHTWPWLNEPTECGSTAVSWPSDMAEKCLQYKYASGVNEERLDVPCDQKTAFVCKIPDTPPTTTTTTAATAAASTTTTTKAPGGNVSGAPRLPVNLNLMVLTILLMLTCAR